MNRILSNVAVLAALHGVACRPQAFDGPVCAELVAAPNALESDTRVLPADVWFSVLLKDFQRTSSSAPAAAKDCSNQPIYGDMDGLPGATEVEPDVPLDQDDLSFGIDREGDLLVWARIAYSPRGDALGPVALARWVEQGVEIRGIGTLYGAAKRVKLYLEPLKDDKSILFVEGDSCANGAEDLAACERVLQLLLLENQRFKSLAVREGDADPVPARFALTGRVEVKEDAGFLRRTSLQRKVKIHDGELMLSEAVRIERCSRDGKTCELDSKHEDERILVLVETTLSTEKGAWFALDGKLR